MEKKNFDLENDEELTALRLAALLSRKPKDVQNQPENALNKISKQEHCEVNQISSIISSANHLSDSLLDFTHNSSRRKHNNASRKKGFPALKNNHRSNLIVIQPTSQCEKESTDENKTYSLALPQHKWCQIQTEDSSSPKNYRRNGPTRFNRYDTDSDSSDSERESDSVEHESSSNETVLQDEPSQNSQFNLSDKSDNESRNSDSEKKPSTRHFFYLSNSHLNNHELPKSEFVGTKELSKSSVNESSLNSKIDSIKSQKNILETTLTDRDKEDKDLSFVYSHKRLDNLIVGKSEQDDYSFENQKISDNHSNVFEAKIKHLSHDDLRFELKKKTQNNNVKSLISQTDKTKEKNFSCSYKRKRNSSSSSTSSSSSLISCSSSSPKIRSISSVIKSVNSKKDDENKQQKIKRDIPKHHSHLSSDSDNHKKASSKSKSIIPNKKADSDSKRASFSETKKRVPVHMRLGILPRKRVIQMPNGAPFSNPSSDDEFVDAKSLHKKPNLRIVAEMFHTNFKNEKNSEEDNNKKGYNHSLSKDLSKRMTTNR